MVDSRIKTIFEKGLFRGEIRYDEPMSAHTSLRIGGPAEVMAFPEDPVSLKNILIDAQKEGIPVFICGGGTNILVRDGGIEGIVISLRAFRSIEFTRESDDKKAVLFAGAGVMLAGLLSFAQKNGCSGLEPFAGIPGYVGGAVHMNAGSFGSEIKDVLVSVALMNMKGEISLLRKDKMDFTYRSSNLPGGHVILSANVELTRDDPDAISGRMKEYLERKRNSHPLGELSAGCVFRNPEGDAAGRLIEESGCKGMKVGDVEVSTVHANYFVNRGKATCRDFLELMDTVRERVRQRRGITLEAEVKIVGKK